MNQIKENFINFVFSISSIFIRDIKIQVRNFSYIISIVVFYLMVILIFVFSIGPDVEQIKILSVSIIWTILILSSSITINKLLKDDYEDGNFAIYQFTGLSFETVAFSKILTSWILFQLPLLIIIAFVSLVLNIDINNIKPLIFTLIVGSPILSILTLIGSAMMLTNTRNLTLGSLIVLPLSIPIIIFAVGSINTDPDLFISQIYILLSILLALLAVAPWIISTCIKIAIQN